MVRIRLSNWARGVAYAAAIAAVTLSSPLTSAWASSEVTPELRSQSQTQMSSAPEVVYVNSVSDPAERTVSFNENWKFYLGDADGAQDASFDDSKWDTVNLPHDYSIDQDYSKNMEAESAYKPGGVGWYRKSFTVDDALKGKSVRIDFDGVYMDSTVWINGHELGNHPYGYTPFAYDLTPHLKVGEENLITVKVNHQTPSSRWYSGSGIGRNVDLVVTDAVHVAKDGVQALSPNLATEKDGSVTTNLKTWVSNDADAAKQVTLVQTVFAKDGGSVDSNIGTVTTSAEVPAGETKEIESTMQASNPSLWSVENPNLYVIRTEVQVDGTTVDTYDTDFGYRYFEFDNDTGFSLNGKKLKIKGVCMHHDQGALGSVDTEAALRRQVRILKDMGCNSIRTSHNTAPRELIEICNEEGMLLDEEIFDGWNAAKNYNTNDYSRFFDKAIGEGNELIGAAADMVWSNFDAKATVKRDFNAPSIIMWSYGNEMAQDNNNGAIKDFQGTQKKLISYIQAVDTSRPVTTGDNRINNNNKAYFPQDLHDAGGVIGVNYSNANGNYETIHTQNPLWKIIGSETVSSINSRGVYNVTGSGQAAGPGSAGQLYTSYDYSRVSWGHEAAHAWYDTIRRDFVAGEYVWTGFDYLGEPTNWNSMTGVVGTWPSPKNSYFGIIDTAGLPKDSYYFYQSQWNDEKNTLHILPAWNEDVVYKDANNGNKVPVVVYTDAAAVELYFTPADSTTAQKIGEKKTFTKETTDAGYTYQINKGTDKDGTEHRNLYFTWQVPYEDGTITAKAYDENGQLLDTSDWDGRKSVKTTGAAAKLTASVDRDTIKADGADLSYITVDVKDAEGNIVPSAKNNVKFEVTGAGELAGVDNGVQPDHQSYRDDNRKAQAGQLVGIVRSTKNAGTITVKITSENLESTTVTINTTLTSGETSEKTISSFKYARYYYVKTGAQLELPSQIEARYSDGTSANVDVAWNAPSADQLSKPGTTFSVTGTAAGSPVSVNVTVIDEVAALLSYSASMPKGDKLALPDARPAAMADGTVLNASFPVTWTVPEGADFSKAGTVTIKGKANVFGKDLDTTATIRVQDAEISLGDNVVNPTSVKLQQTYESGTPIPENKQSDTLDAIKDGSTTVSFPNAAPWVNTSGWSNWATREETNKSALTFEFVAPQSLGQAKIHFFQDAQGAAAYPDANTVKLYYGTNGQSWTELPVTETIGQ